MSNAIPAATAYKTPLPRHPALSLLGLQLVQAQVSPAETNEQLSVYEAIQIPGGFIPLHSHPEVEWMYILEGTLQILAYRDGEPYWLAVAAGESLVVPSNARHALRNTASIPMRLLCITLASIGHFFEEVGRPAGRDGQFPAATLEWKEEFAAASLRHGYWMGSEEENAAIGLPI